MNPYYVDEWVTLYHGRCEDVLPRLEVDALISDPPYSHQTHKGARTGGDGSLSLVDFASVDAQTLRDTFSASRVRRWVVATMDWKHIAEMEQRPPSGLRFVRFGVWVKPNGAPQFTGDRPGMGWEGVCIMHNSAEPMRWNGGGSHAVWTHNKVNSEHPTGKPLSLLHRLVGLFSDPGELILDPYAGGGTTLRAAKDLGRRAIGVELEERHCEAIARRMSQEILDLGAA